MQAVSAHREALAAATDARAEEVAIGAASCPGELRYSGQFASVVPGGLPGGSGGVFFEKPQQQQQLRNGQNARPLDGTLADEPVARSDNAKEERSGPQAPKPGVSALEAAEGADGDAGEAIDPAIGDGIQELVGRLVGPLCKGGIATSLWTLPYGRAVLVQLISCTVRPAPLPASGDTLPAAWGDSWEARLCVLDKLKGSVLNLIAAPSRSPRRNPLLTATAAVVTRMLVRTDLLQCLAQRLVDLAASLAAALTRQGAAPAAEAAEPPTTAACAAKAAAGLGDASEADWVKAPPVTRSRAIASLSIFVVRLVSASGRAGLSVGDAALADTLRELRGAILRSRALEHAARAMMLGHYATALAPDDGTREDPGASDGEGGGRGGHGRCGRGGGGSSTAGSGSSGSTGSSVDSGSSSSSYPNGESRATADPESDAGVVLAAIAGTLVAEQPLLEAFTVGILSPSLTSLMYFRLSEDRSVRVWADALLSGPCVQHFLLLHCVSQLCAVDGGTDYGLPCGASLPPECEGEDMELRAVEAETAKDDLCAARGLDGDHSSLVEGAAGPEQHGGRHRQDRLLSTDLMAMAFHWWAENRTRPCSDRALWAVCDRAAALASAVAGGRAEGSSKTSSSSSSSSSGRPGVSPQQAVDVALAALRCAVALSRNGGGIRAVHARGLWSRVVHIANIAVRIGPRRGVSEYSPLQLLAMLPLPTLADMWAAPGATGASLPASPSPELSAALSAGYVTCLERVARYEARLVAGRQADALVTLLTNIGQIAGRKAAGIASLMSYGEPVSVAALIATFAKAAHRVQAAMTRVTSERLVSLITAAVGLVANLTAALEALRDWDGSGLELHDKYWWRRYDFCSSSFGVRPEAGASLDLRAHASGDPVHSTGTSGTSSGTPADGGGHGGSNPAAGSTPRIPPLQQLSLLATFAAARWLPVVSQLAGACELWAASSMTAGVCAAAALGVQPLLHAYLDCRAVAAAAGMTRWAEADTHTSAVIAKARKSSEGDRAALSWEALLLGPLDVPAIIERAGRAVYGSQERAGGGTAGAVGGGGGGGGVPPVALEAVLGALLHLLVAFPDQGRAVLRAHVAPRVTMLAWLQGIATAAVEGKGVSGSGAGLMQHFLEVAPKVESGGQPGEGDVSQLRVSQGGWAARVAALLPPPFVVAAVLGLPQCANPSCANLEGDSEGGLKLVSYKNSGSGGEALYCSRECRRAHSRLGQGAGTQPRARGRGQERGCN